MAILKMTLAGVEIEVAETMVYTKDVTAQSRCLMNALRYLKQKMKSNTPSTDKIAHAGLDSDSYIARMTSHARNLELENERLRKALGLSNVGRQRPLPAGGDPENQKQPSGG